MVCGVRVVLPAALTGVRCQPGTLLTVSTRLQRWTALVRCGLRGCRQVAHWRRWWRLAPTATPGYRAVAVALPQRVRVAPAVVSALPSAAVLTAATEVLRKAASATVAAAPVTVLVLATVASTVAAALVEAQFSSSGRTATAEWMRFGPRGTCSSTSCVVL